jgi:hypothetical protein
VKQKGISIRSVTVQEKGIVRKEEHAKLQQQEESGTQFQMQSSRLSLGALSA